MANNLLSNVVSATLTYIVVAVATFPTCNNNQACLKGVEFSASISTCIFFSQSNLVLEWLLRSNHKLRGNLVASFIIFFVILLSHRILMRPSTSVPAQCASVNSRPRIIWCMFPILRPFFPLRPSIISNDGSTRIVLIAVTP